jgi:hypothetical protein
MAHVRLRPAILLALIFAFSALAGWGGRVIPFSEQWPFFEALRTTASIVFAIMGAWVALMYPKALESILKTRTAFTSVEEERVHALMLPVKLSTAVLVAVMVAGPFAAWAKRLPSLIPFIDWSRGVSFGLLVFLTLAELVAVVLTLWPIHAAGSDIDSIKRQRKEMAERFKLVQKR